MEWFPREPLPTPTSVHVADAERKEENLNDEEGGHYRSIQIMTGPMFINILYKPKKKKVMKTFNFL